MLMGALLLVQLVLILIADLREHHKLRLPGFITLSFAGLLLFSLVSILTPGNSPGEWSRIYHLLLMFGYFIVSLRVLSFPGNPFRTIVKTIILFALLQSAISILHAYKFFSFFIPYPEIVPIGTMTNVNVLASAIALPLPFLVVGIVQLPKVWKLISGFSLILTMQNLYSTGSRSVYIAILIASVFALLLILLTKWKKLSTRQKGLLALFFVLAVSAPVSLILHTQKWKAFDLNYVKNQDAGSQLRNADQTSSISARLIIWEETLDIIQANPLTGVGPGNWEKEVLKHGLVANGKNGSYATRFYKRPHNDYLQLAAESGLGAVLAFITLLAVTFITGFRALKTSERPTELIAILSAILLFTVDACFAFPLERAFHSIFLIILIAGVIMHGKKSRFSISGNTFLLYSLLSILAIFISIRSIKTIHKQVLIKKIITAREEKNWQYLASFKQHFPIANCVPDPASGTPVAWFIGIGLANSGDQKVAQQYLAQAYHCSPNHPHVAYSWAGINYTGGKTEIAEGIYQTILEIYPDFEEAKLGLSAAYLENGKPVEARQIFESCEEDSSSSTYLQLERVLSQKRY